MFLVDSLYYIVFETPNVERMADFYTNVIGLVETSCSREDQVVLGIDRDRPTLVLRRAEAARVGEIGFFLRGHQGWNGLRRQLSAQGIMFREDVQENLGPTLSFEDCDGHLLRFHLQEKAAALRHTPRLGPRVIRLQHLAYASPNPEKMARFYVDVMNYKISDMMEDGHFYWLRTNMEHHTVSVVAGKRPGLDHFAFELPDWNAFELWCDFLAMHNVDILWGPGRHGPGHNLFFFVLDPDGNRLEFTSELEVFRDEYLMHTPRVWRRTPRTINLWGPEAPWLRELPQNEEKDGIG